MGIERMKTFLRQPNTGLRKLLVHDRCTNLKMELMNYRYPKAAQADQSARKLPIDNFNHLIKAITYFLVEKYGIYDKGAGGHSKKGRLIK